MIFQADAVISKDHDQHASLRGKLYHLHDDTSLDAPWSFLVDVWFEGEREDPCVALLRLDPDVADVWASSTSALKFGFETVRATLCPGHQPDIGVKATVRFSTAA